MKIKYKIETAIILIAAFILTGCAANIREPENNLLKIKEEAPLSILILPPMNESTAAEAKEHFATTLQEPLAFKGYYTFPYPITSEILKMEGIYDTELLNNLPVNKFKEYFGADAVLFTTIKKWDLQYLIFSSTLTIGIEYRLKSTKSNQTLWKKNSQIKIDLSGQSSGDPISSLIINTIKTAVNSSVAEYTDYARQLNFQALSTLPPGRYFENYKEDNLKNR